MEILVLLIFVNLIGLYMYANWHFTGVAHRKQAMFDFICPIGCVLGRIVFKFDMKTNRFAYIEGFILEIFIAVIFLLCK